MIARRLLGLPLAVLVLHLGFAANESQCRASHEAGSAGTEMPADHPHHESGAARTEPIPQETQSPAIPVCCQTLASCSATIALAAGMLAPLSAEPNPAEALSDLRTPPSPSGAPDAPPPRV